jgi:hypothetical protein
LFNAATKGLRREQFGIRKRSHDEKIFGDVFLVGVSWRRKAAALAGSRPSRTHIRHAIRSTAAGHDKRTGKPQGRLSCDFEMAPVARSDGDHLPCNMYSGFSSTVTASFSPPMKAITVPLSRSLQYTLTALSKFT